MTTHYIGGRTAIRLTPSYPCPACDGKGKRTDAKTHELRTCVACNGTGVIVRKVG